MEERLSQTEKSTLRWCGHVKRMVDHRIPKELLEIKLSGRCPRFMPPTQWVDQVEGDVEIIVDKMQVWAEREL
jgi:hypothetical protein